MGETYTDQTKPSLHRLPEGQTDDAGTEPKPRKATTKRVTARKTGGRKK